jgi:hypothetical protein
MGKPARRSERIAVTFDVAHALLDVGEVACLCEIVVTALFFCTFDPFAQLFEEIRKHDVSPINRETLAARWNGGRDPVDVLRNRWICPVRSGWMRRGPSMACIVEIENEAKVSIANDVRGARV